MTSAVRMGADVLPRVLIVGACAEEFLHVLTELRQSIDAAHLRFAPHPADAPDARETPFVDLLIVLQCWPDEFPQRRILDLLDRHPLGRLVVIQGAWCDSAGRTRDVWPRGACVPVDQAIRKIRRELAVLRGEQPAAPLTESRDETYWSAYSAAAPAACASRTIAVRSPDPAIRDWLTVAVEQSGHRLVRGRGDVAEVVLWDIDPWSASVGSALSSFVRQPDRSAVIALGGFVRAEHFAALRAIGVDAVVSKLSPTAEIVDLMQTITVRVADEGTVWNQDRQGASA